MKTKAKILQETEQLVNELEAIRGRCGILETQFGAVVEIYKHCADQSGQIVELMSPVIREMTEAAAQGRSPRARPRRRRTRT